MNKTKSFNNVMTIFIENLKGSVLVCLSQSTKNFNAVYVNM